MRGVSNSWSHRYRARLLQCDPHKPESHAPETQLHPRSHDWFWVLLELVLSSAVLPDYLRAEELKWLTVQVPPASVSHWLLKQALPAFQMDPVSNFFVELNRQFPKQGSPADGSCCPAALALGFCRQWTLFSLYYKAYIELQSTLASS